MIDEPTLETDGPINDSMTQMNYVNRIPGSERFATVLTEELFELQLHESKRLADCFSPNLILRPCQFFLKIHNLFDLHQEPAVDFREVENLFIAFSPWVCRRHISHGNRFRVSAWLAVTLTAGWHQRQL